MSTVISETQAYVTGWVFNKEPVDTEDVLIPSNLNKTLSTKGSFIMYKFTSYDKLEGNRFYDFIRGIFERHCVCSNYSVSIRDSFLPADVLIKLPVKWSRHDNNCYIWDYVNALDLMAFFYYDGITCYSKNMFYTFLEWSNPNIEPTVSLPQFEWVKTDQNAIGPVKSRFSDSGYDLSIFKKIKEVNGVTFFDTGIKVKPPIGYYFEVVGRSSISKTGWMLANNIGIIDTSYRGSIIIALVPVVEKPTELQLPLRIAQLITRKLHLLSSKEVTDLDETSRGNGGFGSTG